MTRLKRSGTTGYSDDGVTGFNGEVTLRKILVAAFLVLAAWRGALAGGEDVMAMALRFYSAGDYYAAITEAMRYQCLYPGGPLSGKSMLLLGKAYYKGGNYRAALNVFTSIHRSHDGKDDGDEALYLAGFVHLMKGLPAEADRLRDLYRAAYRKGRFMEETDRDACFAAVLESNVPGSLRVIASYRERYPRGKYGGDLDRLEKTIAEESGRPRRHLWLGVLGSAFFPGFGQFYTGNYAVGFLTLFTNALCAFMMYDGHRRHDTCQMVFFGIAGGIVYGYNLFGAVRTVNEFNEKRDRELFRRVRLGITASF
ncbi:MAG: outer membrane protein assembly factor BamD [Spirochaetes bacterium]|nr:outer membrane protein assembly factor BamD [Spirochaetota bacterium]